MQANAVADALDEAAVAAERERRRVRGNLRRKLAMLAHHRRHRDPDTGKSSTAVSGGRAAWAKRAEAHPGGERGLALELAMRRWHPEGDGDGR